MKKHHRILALALAAGMTLSLLVTGASAADSSKSSYSDVPATASYSEAVEWLAAEDIMDGIGGGRFGPNMTVTRAQAITAIGRMAKATPVETDQFSDVEADSWYSGYVGWAVSNGIVNGTGGGRFSPDAPISSEQLNLMLTRYADSIERSAELYDTGASTVTRADMAQRLYGFVQDTTYTDLAFTEIQSGPIMGFNYRGVNTFRGVPYATAKRFQAPEKVEPWDTVRPCFNWGVVSYSNANMPTAPKSTEFMTPSDNNVAPGDDCQNVNIWTPSLDADDKLPVLVFLHGGDGNAQELVYYDGNNLARSGNMVFITMNHRGGLIGGLDLSAYGEQYENSAFCKLQDIVAGLQWIRDNVAAFGGDPSNVTLMGQSAGAYDVMRILGVPSANGLYNKVILNSPSGMIQQPTANTKEQAQEQGKLVVDALGLTEKTIDEIGSIPYETLRTAAADVGVRSGIQYVDGEFYLDYGFTTNGEIETNRSLPMMISNTYGESTQDNFAPQVWARGDFLHTAHRPTMTDADVMAALTERYGDNTDKVIELFQAAYPSKDLFWLQFIDYRRRANDDMYDLAEMRLENGGAPLYAALYCYNYPLFGGIVPVHTDGDLPLIFNNVDTIPEQFIGDEAMANKVAAEASTALANFCRTGDPNGAGVPQWPAYDKEQGTMMYFDRVSEARSGHADRDLIQFIEEVRLNK